MKHAALLVLLAGCIDVSAHQLAPGRYLVEAEGKPRHSLGDVLRAAHERAAEICSGYQIADTQSTARSSDRVDVAITIECNGTASAAR